MSLGDKLRSLRIKSKKTLKEQSSIFSVSMNTVYRWEHNLASPRKSVLKRIAEHYSVPMEWLLSDNSSASLVSETEHKLLSMFRKLTDNNRFKVLGYVEHMCIEELGCDDTS